MINNKKQLLILLATNQAKIKRYGVETLELFGSFQRDKKINEKSDVDFLVGWESSALKVKNYDKLRRYLEDLLGRKVDLLTRQTVKPFMAPYILPYAEITLPVNKRPEGPSVIPAKRYIKSDKPYVQELHYEIGRTLEMMKGKGIRDFKVEKDSARLLTYFFWNWSYHVAKIRPSFKKRHSGIPWNELRKNGKTFDIEARLIWML